MDDVADEDVVYQVPCIAEKIEGASSCNKEGLGSAEGDETYTGCTWRGWYLCFLLVVGAGIDADR